MTENDPKMAQNQHNLIEQARSNRDFEETKPELADEYQQDYIQHVHQLVKTLNAYMKNLHHQNKIIRISLGGPWQNSQEENKPPKISLEIWEPNSWKA